MQVLKATIQGSLGGDYILLNIKLFVQVFFLFLLDSQNVLD